jgi:hypothetical protein
MNMNPAKKKNSEKRLYDTKCNYTRGNGRPRKRSSEAVCGGIAINDQKKCASGGKKSMNYYSLSLITHAANFAHHFLCFFVFITIRCSICCFFRGISLDILWWDIRIGQGYSLTSRKFTFYLDLVFLGVTHKKSSGLAI